MNNESNLGSRMGLNGAIKIRHVLSLNQTYDFTAKSVDSSSYSGQDLQRKKLFDATCTVKQPPIVC